MPQIHSINVADAPLERFDPPGMTVLGEDPQGRTFTLAQDGPDGDGFQPGGYATGVMACSPGKVSYFLTQRETLQVLEGEVRIELDNGEVVELGPGDLATLPAGHMSTWTFKSDYKELWVLSS